MKTKAILKSAPQPQRRRHPRTNEFLETASEIPPIRAASCPVFDALTFGYSFEVQPPEAAASLEANLIGLGARSRHGRLFADVRAHEQSVAEARLALSGGANMKVRSDSELLMNPQRSVRSRWGLPALARTLDGSDNVLDYQSYERADLDQRVIVVTSGSACWADQLRRILARAPRTSPRKPATPRQV